LFAHSVSLLALVDESEDPDPWVSIGFVVVRSTPDYAEALRVAESLSSATGVELNLRRLAFLPEHGLTHSKEVCEEQLEAPYPCYVARGRFDAGVYLSVERSDAYESFRPGYFIVVAASGQPDSVALATTLQAVRDPYPDAYLKVAKVYHGCMH